jgi:nicotinate-nucleotide adenylyltransferase
MAAARNERIGLYGGSFDPIHTGHLILAEAAINTARLDRVYFMPTAAPPHKRRDDLSDFAARIEMVKLAIAGNPRFELSLLESAPEVSFTYRSVAAFAERGFGRGEIHLLVGSDSLAEMRGWRNPEEIFSRATVLVLMRPGFDELPPLPPEAAVICMTAGMNAISSSAIRRLAAEGKSIRYLVPEAVERYVESHGLYRP